jgi:Carbamoyltransferase N-terminus
MAGRGQFRAFKRCVSYLPQPIHAERKMLICGIKVSHDGGVAVIEQNRLLFSIEVEKLDNGWRSSALGDLDRVAQILG